MAYARHSSNNRRGRNNNRGGNSNRNNNGGNNRRPQARLNHVYDSNGPEGRVRGTAAQIVEKYESLARDANASGNKVLQQSFLQHAEHYQRVLAEVQKEVDAQNERRAEQQKSQQTDKTANAEKSNSKPPQKSEEQVKKPVQPKENKMTDVPGFLADDTDEKAEKKPRGRKPKTVKIDIEEKTEPLEAEPV